MIDKILLTIKEKYSNERVTDIDGVKIDFDASRTWVHLRKSNTEPIIRIYAEAPTQEDADALAQSIIKEIDTIIGKESEFVTTEKRCFHSDLHLFTSNRIFC